VELLAAAAEERDLVDAVVLNVDDGGVHSGAGLVLVGTSQTRLALFQFFRKNEKEQGEALEKKSKKRRPPSLTQAPPFASACRAPP
jgi:hypothetical protein